MTYGFAGQGAAVCALDGVGNPADQSCLIGPNGQYWAYFRARGGRRGWTYSRGGAGIDHGRTTATSKAGGTAPAARRGFVGVLRGT